MQGVFPGRDIKALNVWVLSNGRYCQSEKYPESIIYHRNGNALQQSDMDGIAIEFISANCQLDDNGRDERHLLVHGEQE
jgi:hypothetical protein